MKFGMRKPNLKKSFKARTTGKAKRMLKKAINPLYGKKGMGIIKNPKKAIYNKIYNKTTFGINDIIKVTNNKAKKKEKTHVENLYKEHEKIDMSKNSAEDNQTKKMKKSDIIRYVIGIIFILGGIGGISSGDAFLCGLVMIILGVSFFPNIYKLLNCINNKGIQIVAPIILFILTFSLIPNSNTVITTNSLISDLNTITNANSLVTDSNVVTNTNLLISNSNIIANTNSTNSISNENLENRDNTNANKIASEANDFNTNNTQTENKIESDTQKIVSNENTKKDNLKSSTTEKETEKNPSKPAITNKSETTTQQTTEDNSRTVYRTPTGKRYHYDPDCGGKNSYATTLNSAISSGLTPCKKCAQ